MGLFSSSSRSTNTTNTSNYTLDDVGNVDTNLSFVDSFNSNLTNTFAKNTTYNTQTDIDSSDNSIRQNYSLDLDVVNSSLDGLDLSGPMAKQPIEPANNGAASQLPLPAILLAVGAIVILALFNKGK